MNRRKRIYLFAMVSLLILAGVLLTPKQVSAQSYAEVFGQNRVQLRKFQWKFFDTKHFRVYHYDKAGRELGRYVAEEAENNIPLIEKKLGGQFPQRFNIILYNSYEEYKQTNVGLKEESPLMGNARAGTMNLVGDKLVVYFTGHHKDLNHQIRTGMARVVMQRMVFGDNFKKMVKNALLLNLPEWVADGYIAYLVDGWDTKSNSKWKSLLDAQPKKGFYEFAEEYPELAGKAFWKFVAEQWGQNTVKNLLYSIQQKTSLNKAMVDKANLGLKVTKAYDSCMHFYKGVYAADAKRLEQPDSTKGIIGLKVPKDNTIIRNIRVSPRGTDISYVSLKDGRYTVNTQRTSGEQEVSTILEGGERDLTEASDPDYPMMAWSSTGSKLAILYKKGPETNLRIYNSIQGRIENYVIPNKRFDRVLGMTFMQDDDKLVFSAIKKSQTDLYAFTIKGSKMTNITDDPWDDLSPVFVSGGARTGILFLSNRPKPDMNVPAVVNDKSTRPMNMFFYNTKTERSELLQCSDIKGGEITQPIQYGLENFAYLYDGNGVTNKYVVLFARNTKNRDSAYSVPVTNYATSILSHQYNLASGTVADVVQYKDKYKVYFHELQMPGVNVDIKKLEPATLSVERVDAVKPSTANSATGQPITNEIIDEEAPLSPEVKSGTAFQSEFSDTIAAPKRKKHRLANMGNKAAPDSSILSEMTDSAYVKMKPSPYKVSFKPDAFQVKLDNTLLFTQYQSIASNGGAYNNVNLSGLTTLSLNEVMENHRITGGFQLPVTSPGSTYFLQYQNFTRRLDWGVVLLRSQNKSVMEVAYVDNNQNVIFTQQQLFKSSLSMVQGDISYPFDRLRSMKFHTGMRLDRLVEKATDTLSLTYGVPPTNTYTSINRLEYVFDNTITPALNILNGTRYKVYMEYMQALNNGGKGCYNIGIDVRNYQKIYKNIILANRLAYAHSDGSSQVEYLLGGVDGWIGAKPGPGGMQPPEPQYGFQTLSTSMRGYKQYARVGNNFMVFSTEFRVPIVATFAKRPIKSTILKNLQFVPFCDIGSAWKGFIPDEKSNDITYYFPSGSAGAGGLNNVQLAVTVPGAGGVAVGYGAGLRSSLFGYFVRMDVAWNVDGTKPVFYLALGTDF